MLRKICVVLLTAIILLCSVSCSMGEAADQAVWYSFTDDTGEKVVLSRKPEKVAVLFSSFADIWQCAGGKTDITVGETVERGFADESALLVDAGAGKTVNTELLIEAQPDFVICSADIEGQAKVAKLLKSSGIPTARFRVESFEDYLRVLKICTDITQNKQAYKENGLQVQERINAMLTQISGEPSRKTILFIRAGSGASATKAKTAEQSFVCAMLKELGTYNIAENAPVLLDGLSLEEILTADPDFIFISTMGKESAAKEYMDSLLTEPAWQALTAVKNNNYAYLPKELFQFKPNSRWDEAYAYLIDLIYE